jgi:5-methylcytosine-specific restriction endonuclease McrA
MMEWDEDTQSEFDLRTTTEYMDDMRPTWAPCPHDRTEIRRRVLKSGQVRYCRQCLTCGSGTVAVAQSNVPNIATVRDFDPSINEAYCTTRARRQAVIKQKHIRLQKAEKAEWWRWYDEYLRSPAWRRKRKLVMDRSCGACEGCRSRPADHVHHLTYDHVGHEFLWELVAVCTGCHDRVHERKVGSCADA